MTNEEAKSLGARCDACPLNGRPIVPPRPSPRPPKLIIVSDSPGRQDENTGVALSGAGGKLLRLELKKRGIDAEECHVTHACLCRPEGDKQEEKAAECCAPRLLRELGILRDSGTPSRGDTRTPALTLGKTAFRGLIGARKLSVARGFLWRVPSKAVPRRGAKAKPLGVEAARKRETIELRNLLAGSAVFPTLSLSFILKADTWAPIFRRDLDRACAAALGRPLESFSEEGGPPDGVGGLEVLEGLSDSLACDIETDGIDPRKCGILCIGFGEIGGKRRVRVIWPWKEEYAKGLGKAMGRLKRVVFHNGFNFDLLVMRNHGVMW